MCEVKAMEGMILRQLDLKQFIQNFVYDGKASNVTAPLVLNSNVEWINQMDKYVPEPQESLATITHKFLNKLANNRKYTFYIPNIYLFKRSVLNNIFS
jgi:hypothetical protein